MLALPTVSVQAEWESEPTDWHFNQNPVKVLEKVKKNANRKKSEEVQKTQLDNTTSKWCTDVWIYSNFTITRTLCYVKNNSWSYLQYVMYFALTAATIFLIWNWFNIVVSSDKEKQMTTFKKNLIYIIVWIVLITCFYYFIDIYVWIINLFTE
jgi:hypothetical protein